MSCFFCGAEASTQFAPPDHCLTCEPWVCDGCATIPVISSKTARDDYRLTRADLKAVPWATAVRGCGSYRHHYKVYPLHAVQELVSSPAVVARREKREFARSADGRAAQQARAAAAKAKLLAKFAKKYHTWRDGLLAACHAMFNLNRYAKHPGCRYVEEIYDAKNELVELLYVRGFATECVVHEQALTAKLCFGCGGEGAAADCHGELVDCDRCHGTGVYLPARTVSYVAFRFNVDGQEFAWHQPADAVCFEYVPTLITSGLKTEVKPVDVTTTKLREGLELVRFVVDAAGETP